MRSRGLRTSPARVLGAGALVPVERRRLAAETYLAFAQRDRARYKAMFLPELRDRARFRALHATGGRALELLAASFAAAGVAPTHAKVRAGRLLVGIARL